MPTDPIIELRPGAKSRAAFLYAVSVLKSKRVRLHSRRVPEREHLRRAIRYLEMLGGPAHD